MLRLTVNMTAQSNLKSILLIFTDCNRFCQIKNAGKGLTKSKIC